ncbi:MBL fold metallo-hydrolase RNA specificity domain-containing protein [Shewanella kaireitica]|uniref:MBL fold metallo-hydrolase RNA specificity domain-containing protein n=1 Tax=Shewanella kaireitica TaxID=212021 RepID=UPI00200D2B4C|nr:MBL fold metallo-hydrolase [Shewanella kaireitica]MCL1095743.1 MBL fold metallo-hydrolase [Shewanella kaireitica]
MQIIHHGAVNGVTGSCHKLDINAHSSVLIDCGLFQGAETAGKTAIDQLPIEFDISYIQALIVTHCHIDHVGRIPYLLAAGFNKPIYATVATAALLPMVIEDALKIGVTQNHRMIKLYLKKLTQLIRPIEYNQWFALELGSVSTNDSSVDANSSANAIHQTASTLIDKRYTQAKAKFRAAGHILGSAYVEIELFNDATTLKKAKHRANHRVVFSGDLGATHTPLLASPKSPYRADTLVIESTYGDKNHQGRKQRSESLRKVIEKSVADNGVVLIPAFSIGRTQELLYELEQVIHRYQNRSEIWRQIEVIVDSPMAAKFTERYLEFKTLWDKEAKQRLSQHRHPLDFEQLYTVGSHQEHLATIKYLSKRNKPAIVIAASGMCTGGRIQNYLAKLLSNPTTDIIFVGYQAQGSTGREIQTYGPKGGYCAIDGKRVNIKAGVHTVSGYSAHADQRNLVNFVKGMRVKPTLIRIVHGDTEAKSALAKEYKKLLPAAIVEIGK